MGRHQKKVNTEIGIDRRETGYYSTPNFIAEFIARAMVEINPKGSRVFDPCIGEGKMAIPFLKLGMFITGMDILPFNLPAGINFKQQDFLSYYREKKLLSILNTPINLDYDFYIANPPYNCHEVSYIKDNKSILSSLFPELGVYNMYSMFISALIDCAKDKALIGLIILDSFLTAKCYANLRQKILQECTLHYLILCPNDLFLSQGADVRTCIMILQKGKQYQQKVKIANRCGNVSELQQILASNIFSKLDIHLSLIHI